MDSVRPEGVRPHPGYRFAREDAVPWGFAWLGAELVTRDHCQLDRKTVPVGGGVSKIGEQPIRFGPAAHPYFLYRQPIPFRNLLGLALIGAIRILLEAGV